MKHIAILMIGLLSLSLLFAQPTGTVKLAANLGWVNGASIGYSLNKELHPQRDYFLSATFGGNSDFLVIGLHHETRFNRTDRFYLLVTAGMDYVRIHELFGDLGGAYWQEQEQDRFKSFLFPHISAGFGFKTPVGKNREFYIEWDIGIKAAISNLNIGFTL